MAAALELLTVKVPEYAIRGGSAKLHCSYKLDDDASLYSLKWYKDDHQFYQYIPGNTLLKNTFFLPGVEVDVSVEEFGWVKDGWREGRKREVDGLPNTTD